MPKPIPATGIIGVVALREAATTEYGQIADLVRAGLDAVLNANPDPTTGRRYFDIEALFPDRVVVELDGRYWAYPYTLADDNQVQLGARVEVIETYAPVTTPLREARDTPEGHFLEARASDSTGLVWDAVLVRSGASTNGRFYPDAVLRESAALFDGRPIFVKGDIQHLKGEGKDVRNIIGYVSATHFVEGAAPDTGYLAATVTFLGSASTLPETIREAWDRGKKDLVGLSIDATGTARDLRVANKTLKVAASINRVDSVDLIVDPGAGGGLVRMREAADPNYQQEDSDMGLKERMLEAIRVKSPEKAAAIDLATVTDDALETAYREAVAPAAAPVTTGLVTLEDLRMVEARASARATIATCTLPQPAKDKLQADFAARERFTEADVSGAINAERAYVARFVESGQVRMPGLNIEITEPRHVVVGQMLDAFFDAGHKDHVHVQSFKEAYGQITGDWKATGRVENCDPVRMREALGEASFREALDSTSFGSVLGNAITRRMIADYRDMGQYDVWRNLADTVPLNDFRTNERTRYGGYGDLPVVPEGDPYQAMTSPTDEKATYAPAKRGGTEEITIEMIRNDDVGAIRRIPTKLSRAAKRTLAKFVLDFIRANPTIYDGLPLFHATHGNLGAAALDSAGVSAGRLAMLKQTELNSLDRIGIGPAQIWVPADLQETATNLFARSTNNDKTFVQNLNLQVNPVWYWTDTNDWAMSADKADIPTVEIGFLDGNQEPEIFIQDNPTVGSLFTHDKVTYKIRHVYGGNVVEFRGLWKSVL
ncbi:hypothetical protein [Zoogloea sp.]|uniref:phage major capsid protein n=1 Tax=Zoogloea sp. TaxID=49181 RepID=UPI00262E9412|nr:hypothetical protein [Zoogloea sp.]